VPIDILRYRDACMTEDLGYHMQRGALSQRYKDDSLQLRRRSGLILKSQCIQSTVVPEAQNERKS